MMDYITHFDDAVNLDDGFEMEISLQFSISSLVLKAESG